MHSYVSLKLRADSRVMEDLDFLYPLCCCRYFCVSWLDFAAFNNISE